jgi:hypothetical protein
VIKQFSEQSLQSALKHPPLIGQLDTHVQPTIYEIGGVLDD